MCLDDVSICSSPTVYSFKATIGPCQVNTFAFSQTFTDIISHYTYETGAQDFSITAPTQTPNCGYTLKIEAWYAGGSSNPSFVTVAADYSKYTVHNTDVTFESSSAYQVELRATLTDYPSVYSPNFALDADSLVSNTF